MDGRRPALASRRVAWSVGTAALLLLFAWSVGRFGPFFAFAFLGTWLPVFLMPVLLVVATVRLARARRRFVHERAPVEATAEVAVVTGMARRRPAAPAAPPPAPEPTDADTVLAWRREQLVAAGYADDEAAELAARADVDLEQARRLLADGCPRELALEILR